jgi:hypothetical protein
MKPIAAAIAFLSASVAAVGPAVASACITAAAACPSSGGGAACGSCGTSSFYGDVSALGAGVLLGIGSVAAEGLFRAARERNRGRNRRV